MVEFVRNSDDTSRSSSCRSTETRTALHRWPWSTCEPAGPANNTHLRLRAMGRDLRAPASGSRTGFRRPALACKAQKCWSTCHTYLIRERKVLTK